MRIAFAVVIDPKGRVLEETATAATSPRGAGSIRSVAVHDCERKAARFFFPDWIEPPFGTWRAMEKSGYSLHLFEVEANEKHFEENLDE